MKALFRTAILLVTVYLTHQVPAEQILRFTDGIFTNRLQLQLIKALAEHDFRGADAILHDLAVENRGTNGATVLWLQANEGNFDAFQYLLRKGSKPTHLVTDAYNTLELCAAQEDSRFLEAAIANGANVNIISYFKRQTAIFTAISMRKRKNVEILLKNGAYLGIADPMGRTPVVLAADGRAYDLVVLLLKSGANPNLKSNQGFDVRKSLQEVNPDPNDPLYDSYREAMKLLEQK